MFNKMFHYANELLVAEQTVKIIRPFSARNKNLNVEDAYKIQLETVKLKQKQGNKVIGRKIGLTSKKMQEQLNTNEPIFGHLFNDMKVKTGDIIDMDTLIDPRIEPEIGFILNRDLVGPNITFLDVIMATEYIVPTLEIIDSRVEDANMKLIDLVADNASSSKIVIGIHKKKIEEVNLRTIGMVLKKNNEVVATGTGSEILGHPAEAVAWLVNKLSEFGMSLHQGEIILTGSLSVPLSVEAGDKILADFGELGKVDISFK